MVTNMSKIAIVIFIIGAVFMGPIWGKTDEEIQQYREFLERTGRYENEPGEPVPLPEDFVRTWDNSGRFQGDILLTDAQIDALVDEFSEELAPRVAVNNAFQLWPNQQVNYEFAPGHHTVEEQYEILRAMSEIGIHTCMTFRERTANDRQFLYITSNRPGCSANVGAPDPNSVPYHTMNLEKRGCFYPPILVHELLHVIGFQHMQCSPERDNYVEIYKQNMINGTEHNFVKLDSLYTTMLNIPYEYGSVMHYPWNAFSKNGQATIWPVQNATQEQKDKMGQQDYVTHWDWIRGRRLYNCQGAWQEPIYVPQHENKPAQYYFSNTRF